MASNNALIVEVVGDTTKLTRGLNKAQSELNRFAGKSQIKSTGADAMLADVRRMQVESEALTVKSAEADQQQALLSQRFSSTAVKAGIAGFAIHVLGTNLAQLGGNAGKAGKALEDLTSLNFVGFVKDVQSLSAVDPAKVGADLLKMGDAAKATETANAFAAIGLDKVAESARNAAAQIRLVTDAFVDNTKIRDSTSPGAIAAETSSLASKKPGAGRAGVSQSQRNTFFDNDITRALDRAGDGALQQQLSKLRKVEATLRERLKVTKDITRQLRLEDEIVGVQRQEKSVESQIADALQKRIADAKRSELERKAKELEALQARQFRALGLAADGGALVPSEQNLRKQLGTLSDRVGSSGVNLGSKLKAELDGARKLLDGEFGKLTRESRDHVADVFDAIRGEFAKQDGPLTKTTSLNTNRLLSGLGLSPDEERKLTARLSRFNSGGQALAAGSGSVGAFGQPIIINTTVELDGQKLATNTTKHQQKSAQANPTQRRGRI